MVSHMRRSAGFTTVVLFGPLLLGACGGQIGVRRQKPQVAHRAMTANAMSRGEPSNPTRIVLRRHDLTGRFDESPAEAIADLHRDVVEGQGGSDEIFALSELSFLYAQTALDDSAKAISVERFGTWRAADAGIGQLQVTDADRANSVALERQARAHFLASAVYAYAFLFPEDDSLAVPLIDPRARVAADFYNSAIVAGLRGLDGNVEVRGGTYTLPFGTLEIDFDPAGLEWGDRTMVDFVPIADYEVIGLNNRYRQPGIGAPLAARPVRHGAASPMDDFLSPYARVPATAILRVGDPRRQLGGTNLQATLEIYAATSVESVTVGGKRMPIETEPSATIALSLQASRFWEWELAAFLGKALDIERPSKLFANVPHRPGRIPVVFVHGTSSNPATWANLVNDLRSIPEINHDYEFWFFSYDSGNPIIYSSMLLRLSLVDIVQRLDPQGNDDCLRQIVVIGHSQGGLLTKMTAIDSGTTFWDAISSKPFDQVKLRRKTRELAKNALFVEPLPFVDRLIFISTPHRGSYLAGPQIVRRLAARLIQIPSDIIETTTELAGLRRSMSSEISFQRVPTSIDNMSPGHPFIRALAKMPVVEGVHAHSIIAVKGDGPVESGNDGVVKYSSAHIEGVESELVVRSGHSSQSNPHTVQEVERILRLHAAGLSCGQ